MAKPWQYSGSAGVVEGSVIANLQAVEAIINDGVADIIFGFDAPTTSVQIRTVKPGEQYSGVGVSLECKTLYFKAASGSQPFRVWGVR